MIDLNAIRDRIRKGAPPVIASESVSAEYHNRCLGEWAEDRRNLTAALDEISALRQLMPKEIVDLLKIRVDSMAKVAAVDAAIESLVKHAPRE